MSGEMPVFSLLEHIANPARQDTDVWGWEPRNDFIYVLPLAEQDRTAGGIVIAETNREQEQRGVVLAVGPGLFDPERLKVLPVEACVGDLVMFGKYSGSVASLEQSLNVLAMRNVEFIGRKRWGQYQLVEHRVDAGSSRERCVYHEARFICASCPKTESVLVEEERARMREGFAKDLGVSNTEPPSSVLATSL